MTSLISRRRFILLAAALGAGTWARRAFAWQALPRVAAPAVPPHGYLYYAGLNSFGEGGLGDTVSRSSPTRVGSVNSWSNAVVLGDETANPAKNVTTLALSSDGSVWGAGTNTSGSIGDGTVTNRSSLMQSGTQKWLRVGGGGAISFGIATDRTLWNWGNSPFGAPQNSVPTRFGTDTNWAELAIGADGICLFLKADGTLWSCGPGSHTAGNAAKLAQGTSLDYSLPTQVGALNNWQQISNGYDQVGAVKSDGTLWMWGLNGVGQLGLGDTVDRSSPVQVGALTNWKFVSCSQRTTLAMKTDGTLWAWGNSSGGLLGNAGATTVSSPVQVGSATNWKQVSRSEGSVLGLTNDGKLWAWGVNTYGQLGLGDTVTRSVPTQVGSETTWVKVCEVLAAESCLAIKTT